MSNSTQIVLVACLGLLLAASGCEESKVTSAQCTACVGKSYSAADCARWGAAAGCASSRFLPTVGGGCINACAFEDCDTKPECGGGPIADAAVPPDYGPECQGATGLFSSCDLCPGSCHQVNINGAIRHTCACGSPCPCGFSCGSIPLSVGGVISSVCAPP